MKQQSISEFFNRRAASYASNHFVRFLFEARERKALNRATTGLRILDVGCGTGRFYDHLRRLYPRGDFTYFGIDPAAAMLANSAIPAGQRQQATVATARLPPGNFDLIVLLGVSTYLSRQELQRDIAALSDRLTPDGRLVLQFTNQDSWEIRVRRLLHPLLRRLGGADRVATADFSVTDYERATARQLFPQLEALRILTLPATLPGLQYFSPHLAIRLSRFLGDWAPHCLRMDFMIVYGRV